MDAAQRVAAAHVGELLIIWRTDISVA